MVSNYTSFEFWIVQIPRKCSHYLCFRWGIIGVVEQFILNRVEILQYLNEVEKISSHIGRLCPNIQNNSDNFSQTSFVSSHQNNVTPTLRINCEKEYAFLFYFKISYVSLFWISLFFFFFFFTIVNSLQLALYRHWTVESSLKYTMFTAVALKLWAIKGEKRLHQLLAEMGFVINFLFLLIFIYLSFRPASAEICVIGVSPSM